MSDVFIGRYKVIEELGRGGMGIVYRAEDPALDRPVAIKVLPPKKMTRKKAVKRFLREARVCARLDHPNIIKIHDIGEVEGIYHIVMEMVEGRSLRDLIEERDGIQHVDMDHMIDIFKQMCDAMAYAHRKQVTHRDIKPDNIMLNMESRVKVMDFGLAVLEDRHSLTEMGQVMGTVAYFSPEQARGDAADHRSDIYSMGAVFFEMLTNQLIFQASNPAEMISKQLSSPPPNPSIYNPAIPKVLSELILLMLRKDPDERPKSVEEIIDFFEKWEQKKRQKALASAAASFKQDREKTPDVENPAGDMNREYMPDSMRGQYSRSRIIEEDDQQVYQKKGHFGAGVERSRMSDRDEWSDVREERIKKEIDEGYRSHAGGSFGRGDVPMGGSFARPGTEKKKRSKPSSRQQSGFEREMESTRKKSRPGEYEADSRRTPPQDFDKTYQEVTRIPVIPDTVKPKQKEIKPTSGEQMVASPGWVQESQKNPRWDRYQHVMDRIKKDEKAVERAGAGETPIPCPRCGAENEPTRRYCHECGNLLSQFMAQKQAMTHYKKGRDFLNENKLKEAAEEFLKAVEKDPSLYEAFMYLGKVYGNLGEYKDARAAYRNAAGLKKDDAKPHVLIGDLYRLENRRDDAIYEYRKAAKINPMDVSIRNQLALLYSQRGDTQKAIDEYQGILSVEPNNLEAHRQLGYMFMARGRNEEAIKEFEWVLRLDPEDEQVQQVLGGLYVKVGSLRNAEQTFYTMLEENPHDSKAMAALGEIYMTQNRVDLALDSLSQAIETDEGNVEARKTLADIYKSCAREDLAQAELEKAIKYTPEDPEIHKDLGDLYLKTHNLDKALYHFQKTVSLNPDNAELHHKLAELYNTRKFGDLSVHEYKKAVQLEPYNPEYREDLSMAFYSNKSINEAIKEMRKAATLDSTNLDYKKALGIMYEENNQLDMAELQFKQIIQENPIDAMAMGMLGQVYAKRDLLSMAIMHFKKALKLKPDSHLFNVYLGRSLVKQGNTREAVKAFKRAIELAPGGEVARGTRVLAKAYTDLGKAYLDQGELDKAHDVLNSAIENNPLDTKALHYLGLVFYEKGQYEKAQEQLSKALKREPQNADILQSMASVFLKKGDLTLALSTIKKSLMLAPPNLESLEIQARTLQKLGRKPEVDNTLKEAGEKFPEFIDYIYWVKGSLASEDKNWEKADRNYKKAIQMSGGDWSYYKDHAKALENLGDIQEALKQLEEAIICKPPKEKEDVIRSEMNRLKTQLKKSGRKKKGIFG